MAELWRFRRAPLCSLCLKADAFKPGSCLLGSAEEGLNFGLAHSRHRFERCALCTRGLSPILLLFQENVLLFPTGKEMNE